MCPCVMENLPYSLNMHCCYCVDDDDGDGDDDDDDDDDVIGDGGGSGGGVHCPEDPPYFAMSPADKNKAVDCAANLVIGVTL